MDKNTEHMFSIHQLRTLYTSYSIDYLFLFFSSVACIAILQRVFDCTGKIDGIRSLTSLSSGP